VWSLHLVQIREKRFGDNGMHSKGRPPWKKKAGSRPHQLKQESQQGVSKKGWGERVGVRSKKVILGWEGEEKAAGWKRGKKHNSNDSEGINSRGGSKLLREGIPQKKYREF